MKRQNKSILEPIAERKRNERARKKKRGEGRRRRRKLKGEKMRNFRA